MMQGEVERSGGSTFNAPAVHERFEDLEELRVFARRLLRRWDREVARPFVMKREYAEVTGPLVWSFTNHVVELVRTVVDLSEQDRMIVGVPLIRLATENAMTAVWLYLSPAGGRAVIHEGLRLKRAAIDDVLRLGAEDFTEEQLVAVEAQLAEQSAHKLPAAGNFGELCRQLVDGLGVYATWRVMSSYSHAGLTMGDFYLREAPPTKASPLGLSFEPDARLSSHEAWLGTAVCMLIAALKACDQIDAEGRHRKQINRAVKRMGITVDFRLSADESHDAR